MLLPIVERRIPVIADQEIDPRFGTGAVKVTPAHDPLDFEIGRRHGLPAIDVIQADGRMTDDLPNRFAGLDRFEARKLVVREFERLGLLRKTEPHTHAVGHCYRCDTVVEPRLSEQWFVRMAPLAAPALAAYRDGTLRFIPERRGEDYAQWMENIRDWCISRQLWWGHRIPVWYCQDPACGAPIASRTDLDDCPACHGPVRQDEDVLDTWFSLPAGPVQQPRLARPDRGPRRASTPATPWSPRPEILFFWVARMVMAGLEFMGELPFTTVYLHGTVRDTQHRKMSKSLGNGIDPLDVVERFGADALRYTMISGAGGRHRPDPRPRRPRGVVRAGPQLRQQALERGPLHPVEPRRAGAAARRASHRNVVRQRGADPRRPLDHRPLRGHRARGHRGLRAVPAQRRGGARSTTSSGATSPTGTSSRSSRGSTATSPAVTWRAPWLPRTFDVALQLLHPVMPFITETLWRRLPGRAPGATLDHLALAGERPPRRRPRRARDFAPDPGDGRRHPTDPRRVRRPARPAGAGLGLAPATRRSKASWRRSSAWPAPDRSGLASLPASPVAARCCPTAPPSSSPSVTPSTWPRNGRDSARETERLNGLVAGQEKKLGNEQFVARAPAEIVAKEREKLASWRQQAHALAAKLAQLGSR